MARPRVEIVTREQIRKLFNAAGYEDEARSGKFTEKLIREGHPSPADSGEPPCTKSQIVAYFDKRGYQVALVHQYVRTDGSLGGSGRPDPKKLFSSGVLYVTR